MSDGLTTPFALAAGLAGAETSNLLVVIGGLAEVAAGSISMGLGGYLAAKRVSPTRVTASSRARWRRRTRCPPRSARRSIPLAPYMLGGSLDGAAPLSSAVQTLAIGGAAAAVAYWIGRTVSSLGV